MAGGKRHRGCSGCCSGGGGCGADRCRSRSCRGRVGRWAGTAGCRGAVGNGVSGLTRNTEACAKVTPAAGTAEFHRGTAPEELRATWSVVGVANTHGVVTAHAVLSDFETARWDRNCNGCRCSGWDDRSGTRRRGRRGRSRSRSRCRDHSRPSTGPILGLAVKERVAMVD